MSIPQTTITELNKIFNVDFKFENSLNGYDYYTAEVKNPLPYLFKKIEMKIEFNVESNSGTVNYQYAHHSFGSNGSRVGFIENGKFKHINVTS